MLYLKIRPSPPSHLQSNCGPYHRHVMCEYEWKGVTSFPTALPTVKPTALPTTSPSVFDYKMRISHSGFDFRSNQKSSVAYGLTGGFVNPDLFKTPELSGNLTAYITADFPLLEPGWSNLVLGYL